MVSAREKIKPQMKAPRVAPLEGASTSTVAPVDVAHTYGSSHTWINVSMHCGGHDADERRFVDSDIQRKFVTDNDCDLFNLPHRTQSSQRSFLPFEFESEKILQQRHGTRMTRIGWIFTDPWASVPSVQSVFYRSHSRVKNQISAFICVDPVLINRAGGT